MGEQQFLQLLVTQLQNQNPLDPVDNTQFIAELAQFSALQQEQANGQIEQQSLVEDQSQRALALDGHKITYSTGTSTLTDVVQGQAIAGSSVELLLQSGAAISLDSVLSSN